MKNELIGLDDSETSICDLDPDHVPEMYSTSAGVVPGSTPNGTAPGPHPHPSLGPPVHDPTMFVPSPLMPHSRAPPNHHIINMPNLHHHPHHSSPQSLSLHQTLSLPGGGTSGLLSQHNTGIHQLGPNMTPIDKLYSMQSSYFASGSAPSECEC